MRITSGQYRGLKVACPPGEIRPAMDRMRESLFAILGNMEGARFLDLFAGSGIMALEAASRGASVLWLVEKDRAKAKTLYQNMHLAQQAEVNIRLTDVQRFIKKLPCFFNFIHLDPPFPLPQKEALLQQLADSPQVTTQTLITIHYPKEDHLAGKIGTLICEDLRTYGRSYVGFYRKGR